MNYWLGQEFCKGLYIDDLKSINQRLLLLEESFGLNLGKMKLPFHKKGRDKRFKCILIWNMDYGRKQSRFYIHFLFKYKIRFGIKLVFNLKRFNRSTSKDHFSHITLYGLGKIYRAPLLQKFITIYRSDFSLKNRLIFYFM